ncbi:SIMPL domain-containing protein [Azomonas macrocytogenes]|uniref:Putative secreted protein n=1 Tax=Azomonas macrocytogenes TaxID=69962 RepID=A0A839SYU2_AZOMA|nr:SIMPL domain-containing protein [Azomonas macrocytogenes]MBB3102048.1 putative secreted protein [Azomonas macrocytogenes]
MSVPKIASLSLALATSTLLCYPAFAEQNYNQVSLRTEVDSEVVRDRMHVTLYTEEQSSDPAKLAATITQTLNKAIQQARQAKGVEISTGSRSSRPVYEKDSKEISAWREHAEIRLESSDFSTLSSLTGELMKTLKMSGMYFSVSNALRKQNEDAMLKDAVTAFKARAQVVTEALGASSYKLISLNLNNGSGYQPIMRSMAMKADMHTAAAPIPEIEAGTQQITVSADGTIEVQLP